MALLYNIVSLLDSSGYTLKNTTSTTIKKIITITYTKFIYFLVVQLENTLPPSESTTDTGSTTLDIATTILPPLVAFLLCGIFIVIIIGIIVRQRRAKILQRRYV